MAQAVHKGNLSRRGALAALAASSAVIAATEASAMTGHPDTELLRLGEILKPIDQERRQRLAEWRRLSKATSDAVKQATGIAREDAGPYDPESVYWQVHDRICRAFDRPEETDENGLTEVDRFNDRLFAVLNEILALRATTLDGLRVQARAAAIAVDRWEAPQDDEHVNHEKLFIESVCGFLGMDAEAIHTGMA